MTIRPLALERADEGTRAALEGVKRSLGMLPNLHAVLAHSPAALRSYLALSEQLGKGLLERKTRERIALAMAGANACDYCASAHTLLGGKAGIAAEEMKNNLRGESDDPKSAAALDFVRRLVDGRGRVDDDSVPTLRRAGFADGEIVEIVAHVAMNVLSNYLNHVAGTEIDFPVVSSRA